MSDQSVRRLVPKPEVRRGGTEATERDSAGIWRPFLWASLALAISAGFGLGAAQFAAMVAGAPIGAWWLAAAQAHGHVQLFGWAGLLVIGVGLHFLPRLRGAPLARSEWARIVVTVLVSGLVLRAVTQPLLAVPGVMAPLATVLRVGLIGSAVLELAGGGLVLWMLVATLRHGPPLRTRAGFWPVLPFFAMAFGALCLALMANVVGVVAAAIAAGGLVPAWADLLTVHMALYGFLVPIAAAMSERTFGLFFCTPRPNLTVLRTGLPLLLAGLALRISGDLMGVPFGEGVGDLLTAAALVLFTLALGIFAPRRALPRQTVRPFSDPLQLHAISAYLWLVCAGLLLMLHGVEDLGLPLPAVSPDAERHILGAGFVTMLIFGVGSHLLSGFAKRRPRSRAPIWLTLVCGHMAALLRVAPLLWPASVAAPFGDGALSLAGIAGLVAVIAFGVNIS